MPTSLVKVEFDQAKILSNLRKHKETEFASSPYARPAGVKRRTTTRKKFDFSEGKRGAVMPSPGKTRITIMLDDDVLEHFRASAEAQGIGYQTMINTALRAAVASQKAKKPKKDEEPLTVAKLREVLREVLREELRAA